MADLWIFYGLPLAKGWKKRYSISSITYSTLSDNLFLDVFFFFSAFPLTCLFLCDADASACHSWVAVELWHFNSLSCLFACPCPFGFTMQVAVSLSYPKMPEDWMCTHDIMTIWDKLVKEALCRFLQEYQELTDIHTKKDNYELLET